MMESFRKKYIKMNWNLKIDNRDNAASIYDGETMIGIINFEADLPNFLKFLSLLPRNRIKVINPQMLKEKGVPLELTAYGKLSITNTIKKLIDFCTPTEIAQATGIPEKTVNEYFSRLRSKK
jgi:hypothetical protein